MREYTAPGEVPLPENANLLQPLFEHAERTPDKGVLAYREGDRFVDVSAQQFRDKVRGLARGLVALGVQPGDRVAIMSTTRIEWVYLDYAILAAGGVTVPIYDTSSAEQLAWILSDSEVRVAFFENADLKATYDEVAASVPTEETLVITEGALEAVEQRGQSVDAAEIDQRIANVSPSDVATIIYTSGTTGRPKGCVLTHGNLRWDVLQTKKVVSSTLGPEDSQLLFLPVAHSFAKILMLLSIELGAKVGFATSPQHLVEELPIFQPTFVASVPRVFEKVFNSAQQKAHAEGKGKIFDKAAEVATAYSEARHRGSVPLGLKLQHTLFDKLVYGKLRAVFGGRLNLANSGGGPLGARLCHFFDGVGVQIYEGYGLTETSPVLTTNHPDGWKIGSVGQPVPGTTIQIADDGEILAKGGQIFQGYHNNEAATKEILDDGWFYTGDIGDLDDEGFLRITGRKKELIVTAGGKNVAPAVLEDRLRAHVLISQAMVVGDNKPFIAALVTIDEEQLPTWAEQHGKEGRKAADLVDDADLRAEIEQVIAEANKAVSRAESIRKYTILPQDFTIEGGELTPTLKVKRNVVTDRYADEIENLFV